MQQHTPWATIISNHDPLKESVIAYCGRVGISPSKFYHQRQKLQMKPPQFVSLLPSSAGATDTCVQVAVGRFVVRVQRGFDEDTFRRVLQVALAICEGAAHGPR
jgi:hypothetical protein